jgi:hypothetical protein
VLGLSSGCGQVGKGGGQDQGESRPVSRRTRSALTTTTAVITATGQDSKAIPARLVRGFEAGGDGQEATELRGDVHEGQPSPIGWGRQGQEQGHPPDKHRRIVWEQPNLVRFERTEPCCNDLYLSALQQVGSRSYDGAREALRVSQPD